MTNVNSSGSAGRGPSLLSAIAQGLAAHPPPRSVESKSLDFIEIIGAIRWN